MKLTLGNYEIDIKVKSTIGEERRCNKTDTMYFLNRLSSAFSEAAILEYQRGFAAIAKESEKYGDDIYEFLDSLEFYDDIR